MNEESFAKEILCALKNSNEMVKTSNKRQFIIIIVLIAALMVSNCYWVWYNSQWEYETVYVESGDGVAVYSEDGDVNAKSGCQETKTEESDKQEGYKEKSQNEIE